jgi:hypothetical protein
MVQTEWNREKIANLLATSDKAVERALVVVFNNQEADEHAILYSNHKNGVGFTVYDANIFSSFAKQVLNGRTLSVKQMVIARKPDKFGNMKIARYWKQLQAEIVRKENTKKEFTYKGKGNWNSSNGKRNLNEWD